MEFVMHFPHAMCSWGDTVTMLWLHWCVCHFCAFWAHLKQNCVVQLDQSLDMRNHWIKKWIVLYFNVKVKFDKYEKKRMNLKEMLNCNISKLLLWLQLTVQATDQGVPNRVSQISATVTINILRNLNCPVFANLPNNITVPQSTNQGARIYNVTAFDQDAAVCCYTNDSAKLHSLPWLYCVV